MAKEDTRGQKTIVKENQETLNRFYLTAGTSLAVYLVLTISLFWDSFTLTYQVLTLLTIFIYGFAIGCMKYGARPVYNEKGQLIDGGVDLNMKDGYVEHLKDLIIWTAICQTLSLFWVYFWFLLVVIPFYAGYLLWVNVLAPYIFQPAPEVDQEQVDKKNRKRDRQMRRMQ